MSGTVDVRTGDRPIMTARTDRIEARIAPDAAEKIRQAAALSGASTSAFMVDAALDRAERLLRRQHETVVSTEYFEKLLAWLDEPGEPNAALERAFKRLRDHVIRRVDTDAPVRQRTASRKPRTR